VPVEEDPTLKPKEVAQMVADHFSREERLEDTLTGILDRKAQPCRCPINHTGCPYPFRLL
jgi:hypothetical protein